MKLKILKKKIRRLEKRLQEGSSKLAKLKQNLQAAESAKAMKAARKSAACATAAKSLTGATKPSSAKKPKKKLNLTFWNTIEFADAGKQAGWRLNRRNKTVAGVATAVATALWAVQQERIIGDVR